jgi:hypothetical protein
MQLSEASCPPFCSARPSDNIERNRRAPRDTSLRRNARNKQGSGSVSFSNSLANIVAGRQRGIGQKRGADVKRLMLIAVLVLSVLVVLAASPAVAQRATSNGQSQSAAQGVLSAPTPAPSQGPTTGVFCIEEMTATFCNVVTGPNTNGYGTRSGSASRSASGSSSGAGGNTSSIPPCPAEPPFNELCN